MNQIFKCMLHKSKYLNISVVSIGRLSTSDCLRDTVASMDIRSNKPVYQSVADFYAGKSVFLTGATGFVGRLLIERLLFTCKDIDTLYVLIRAKENASIYQRLQETFDNPVFTKLKQTRPQDLRKVVPVAGDVTKPKLGLSFENEQTLIDKVSVVFHSAANVRFTDSTSNHMLVNYEGTKKVMDLGKKMKNLDLFVYVSSAFENNRNVVDEMAYPPTHKIEYVYEVLKKHANDPRKIRNLLLELQGNSYVFSKKMADSLVASDHGSMPAIIVKPSMVTSVYKEPLAGYTDSWVIGTGLLCDISSGLTRVLYGSKRYIVDFIPADYVCNFLIVAAARNSRTKECKVFNIATSDSNPINWERLCDLYIKESKKQDYVIMSNPSVHFTKVKWALPVLIFLKQTLPSLVADIWLRMTGRKTKYIKLQKGAVNRIYLGFPITNTSWIFKTARTQQLISSLDENDKKTFPFDPSTIDWDEYVPIYCKGVKDYMLKNGNKNK